MCTNAVNQRREDALRDAALAPAHVKAGLLGDRIEIQRLQHHCRADALRPEVTQHTVQLMELSLIR